MKTHRTRAFLALVVLALAGSCVSKDSTGVGEALGTAGVVFQPSVIPSPANAGALPINRIRLVAVRNGDDAVLADSSFAVTPTDTAWTLNFRVRLTSSPTSARVYVYLVNVPTTGAPVPQFSGVTGTLTLRARETVTAQDFPLVRGPLDNLSVTGITITSSSPSVPQGQSMALGASVTKSSTTANPVVFWTSLDTTRVRMTGSLATGVAVGTASVVASAGAFADTVAVSVLPRVASVTVSPDSTDVTVGGTTTYTAATFDAAGNTLSGRVVTWTTVSSAVATVGTSSGVVTGVSAGTTSVIATSEGVSDTAKVVVLPPVTGSGGQNQWLVNSGTWSNPANWSLGRVPIPEDTVLINRGGDYDVQMDANVTVAGVVIQGVTDVITLYLNGFTLTITNSGLLDLQTWGNLEANGGAVDLGPGAINNVGSIRLTGQPTFTVGQVNNAGLFTVAADAQATLTYSGGTNFVMQGGTLSLEPGAELTLEMGNFTYYSGPITGSGLLHTMPYTAVVLWADLAIDGPSLAIEDQVVAGGGRKRLTIGPGSTLLVDAAPRGGMGIGPVIDVQGTALMYGPNIALADSLYVASGGGLVVGTTSATSVLTADVDNSGSISLIGAADVVFGPGAGRQILNRPGAFIDVQSGGNRSFNGRLMNQGSLSVGAPTVLYNRNTSGVAQTVSHVNTGTVSIYGGSLTVELGGSAPAINNGGTISVGAGTTLAVVNLSDAQIINVGVLEGVGTIDFTAGDPAGVNNGVIRPGLSGPGQLAWAGTVPMGTTGSIDIELGGTTPGTGYDQLNVGVNLALFGNGALNVSTINGFVPSPGDRFGVITTPASDLDFAEINLPTLPGLAFSTTWAADGTIDTLFVEVSAAPAGSLNRWSNPVSGNWSSAASWSLNRVPQAGDSVVIDVDGTYTVTIDQPADAAWISVGGATGVQTLVNAGWTVSSLTGMDIGANGAFSIPGGGSLSGTGILTNDGVLTMGGGTIINALGVDNSGTWTILPGGSVTQNAGFDNTGVLRFVHSTGLTAMALAGNLVNGGTLILEDSLGLGGPDLRINSGTLYNQTFGVIQTAGPGTTAYIRGPIANGGSIVTTGNVVLGNTPTFGVTHTNDGTIGGTARIAWTNVDGFVNNGSYDGSAEVDMSFTGNGAGFINAGDFTTGVGSSLVGGTGANLAAGTLTVANGVLDLSTTIFVNEGDVNLASGATLAMANDVTLAPGALLRGSGTVDNTYTTAGVLAGDVAPGGVGQVGTLTWVGDYEPESSSAVLIELAGTAPGQYDQLDIQGQTDAGFTFDGALDVTTLSFTPQVGDRFPVLIFDDRAAPFATVSFPTLTGVVLDTLWTANTGLANPDTLYIVAKPLPLALSSARAGVGDRDIWLTAKDGSSSAPLTSSADNDFAPRWSPDGAQIVFTRQPSTGGQLEIWTMDADGSNATRRTPGVSQSDSEPAWSSDGSRIVYTHDAGQSQDLWYMNKDGSGQTELTVEPGFAEKQPDWSPTADSIVFVSDFPTPGADNIWVMDFASPQNAVAITTDAGINRNPQWSPDGSQIVFASDRTGNFEIWVMDRDGSNPQQLTNAGGVDGTPTWSPDGTRIYFASDRTGNFEIWVMDKDGTNPTQVTNDPAVDDGPSVLF